MAHNKRVQTIIIVQKSLVPTIGKLALLLQFATFTKAYFLNFSTSDRPFLKILLLTTLPFLSAFCSS